MGEAEEDAEGINPVAGGFEGTGFIAVEGGLGEGCDEIEGVGIDAVSESEAMGAGQGAGFRDEPESEGVGFVERDWCGWWLGHSPVLALVEGW